MGCRPCRGPSGSTPLGARAVPAAFRSGRRRDLSGASLVPLVVLVGEAGRGKSLACERFLQSAIATARDNGAAPTPVFLAATEATGDLRGALANACSGLADPGAYGARVVIDGADETGERSAMLLAEARELVLGGPDTQVIISSRPLPVFEEIEERIDMPELSEPQALETAALAAGRQVTHGEYMGWAEPLRDASKVPLFALLIGERLRRGEDLVRSRAELLAALADLSIGPQSGDARAALRKTPPRNRAVDRRKRGQQRRRRS